MKPIMQQVEEHLTANPTLHSFTAWDITRQLDLIPSSSHIYTVLTAMVASGRLWSDESSQEHIYHVNRKGCYNPSRTYGHALTFHP